MELTRWLRAQWDRVAAVVLSAAGVVALIGGWYGAASEKLPAGQIPYVVSGGLVGIALIGLGATAWLSADIRDEWRKLDRLEGVGLELLRRTDEPDIPPTSKSPAFDVKAAAPAQPATLEGGNGTGRRRASRPGRI
jgi:hypothetical protein